MARDPTLVQSITTDPTGSPRSRLEGGLPPSAGRGPILTKNG